MELPAFEKQPEVQPRSTHNVVQTLAPVITALSAVAAAIATSKDRTVAWVLVGVCLLAVLVMIWPFIRHRREVVKNRKRQTAKDHAARGRHQELLRFATRFGKFTNAGDPNNILHIIQNSCANDMEKAAKICPPDYMRDLFPVFIQQLETRPPENERQFLLAVQELRIFVASYNSEYVSEPLRKMRTKLMADEQPFCCS